MYHSISHDFPIIITYIPIIWLIYPHDITPTISYTPTHLDPSDAKTAPWRANLNTSDAAGASSKGHRPWSPVWEIEKKHGIYPHIFWWWLSHPSEKYRLRQLGWFFAIYGNCSKPPTSFGKLHMLQKVYPKKRKKKRHNGGLNARPALLYRNILVGWVKFGHRILDGRTKNR